MKSAMRFYTRKLMRLGVYAVMAASLAACSSLSSKPAAKIDYSQALQQEKKPLSTELGDKEQYEFVLDLARFQLKHGRYQRAEKLLQRLRRERHDDIRLYRLLAKSYEGQKKVDLALVARREVVKLPEKTLDDQAELARLALMRERFSEADGIYRSWLNKTDVSTQVSALNNLGFSALLQKKYRDAKGYFDRALQKDPLNAKALNNLQLLKSMGDA